MRSKLDTTGDDALAAVKDAEILCDREYTYLARAVRIAEAWDAWLVKYDCNDEHDWQLVRSMLAAEGGDDDE